MDTLVTLPNHTYHQSYLFKFEEDFEHQVVKSWFNANWVTICAYASALYMVLIFGGQHYMSTRPRFELKRALTVWNIFLGCFSIMGACRTLPELLDVTYNHGIYHSVCVPSFIESNRVSGFWTVAFVMSKVPELGDTVFIVLRKQPLIFLHWYHHVTVLLYSWFSFSEYNSAARWFIVMNYLVHSVMYSYYAFKALKFRVPRSISMVITAMQLIQMVVGCLVNFWVIQMKQSGLECNVSDTNIKLSLVMYTSYFVLFGQFFYNSYLSPKKNIKEETKIKSN